MIASDELQRISDLIKKFKYQFLPESDDEELSEYEILSRIFLGMTVLFQGITPRYQAEKNPERHKAIMMMHNAVKLLALSKGQKIDHVFAAEEFIRVMSSQELA